MFDIAWSEFLVVAVVALVVIGPRDLPPLLRQLGKTVATLRRMAGDFQSQFNEALREAELDDLQKDLTGLKDTANKMVSAPDPFKMARDEIRSALTAPSKPTPSALAGAAATGAQDAPSALAPEPEADVTSAPSGAPAADPELPARANGSTHPSGSDPVAASGDPAPGARA